MTTLLRYRNKIYKTYILYISIHPYLNIIGYHEKEILLPFIFVCPFLKRKNSKLLFWKKESKVLHL